LGSYFLKKSDKNYWWADNARGAYIKAIALMIRSLSNYPAEQVNKIQTVLKFKPKLCFLKRWVFPPAELKKIKAKLSLVYFLVNCNVH